MTFNTYLSLICEFNAVVAHPAGTSPPPSLGAVKAFVQTAGETTHVSGESEKETINEDGDNLPALNHLLPQMSQIVNVTKPFVFSQVRLHYDTHMKAIFYSPVSTPTQKQGSSHDGSPLIIGQTVLSEVHLE